MTADLSPLRLLLVTLAGWVNRHQFFSGERQRLDRARTSLSRDGTHVRCRERLGGLLWYDHRAA